MVQSGARLLVWRAGGGWEKRGGGASLERGGKEGVEKAIFFFPCHQRSGFQFSEERAGTFARSRIR